MVSKRCNCCGKEIKTEQGITKEDTLDIVKDWTEWERLEISSRKLEIPREHFMQNGLDKGQKWSGPNRSRRY